MYVPTLLEYAKLVEWLANELSHHVEIPKDMQKVYDDARLRAEMGRFVDKMLEIYGEDENEDDSKL